MKNNPLAYFVGGAVICAVLLAFFTRDRWQGKPDAVQIAATTAQSVETKQPAQTSAQQNESAKTESEQTAAIEPKAELEAAKASDKLAAVEPKAGPEPAPEPAKPAEVAIVKPSIDNVIVADDGMAMVSGRAKAGTKLKIMLGEKMIGEAIANGVGDWYLSPEPVLPPGEHNLVAVATPESGEPVQSAPSSKIIVAEKAEPEPQTTAQAEPVEKQPEISEQQPAAQEETPETAAGDQEVAALDSASKEPAPDPATTPDVKAEPAPEPTQTPAVEAEPAPEPEIAAAPATAPEPQLEPIAQSSLGLDYSDAGDIMVSGKSEPGSKVRIVVNNKSVGEVLADAGGQWLFKDDGEIAPGLHDLRADKVLSDGMVVEGESFKVERADPGRIAQPQPEPVKENETVATKSPEPASPAAQEAEESQSAEAQIQSAGSDTERTAAALAADTEPAQETLAAAGAAETEPVAAEATASTPPAQGRVVIQPGNNLWNISRVIYGRGVEYTTIYEANKDQIRNPHRIYPGQIFMTPGTVPPEEIDPARREPLSVDEKQVQ